MLSVVPKCILSILQIWDLNIASYFLIIPLYQPLQGPQDTLRYSSCVSKQ